MKIELDERKLTKEEKEQLQRLIDKGNRAVPCPKVDENYFYANTETGEIDHKLWANDKVDYFNFAIGNCFATEEECEFEIECWKVKAELQRLADELNDGWKPDWGNDYEDKFSIVFQGNAQRIKNLQLGLGNVPLPFCKTEDFLEQAIDTIGIDRLKKYYFKVENKQ